MTTLALAWLAAAAAPSAIQAPEMYRAVTSVHWVVRDLDAVKQGWGRLGFPSLKDFGEVPLALSVRGQAVQARVRVAMTVLPGLTVYWIQPVEGATAYAEFLKQHGDGIFSLNHRAPSLAALEAEVARLGPLGVGVLQRSEVETDAGTLTVVHLDTEGPGKYALCLVHGSAPGEDTAAPAPPFPVKLAQFAFVVRDLAAVSAFWKKVGLPELELTHPAISDRLYHGQPASFDQELGWQRHGAVTYEWIRSVAAPTVYDDFLKAHGEGLHHLAFEVSDLDRALASWKAAGFEAVQSGAWGEKGKPGSGRYAYVGTESVGGVFVELLWNQR
jgi:catechol 2,3-dioxygenase-like lactoylglutathione lyase family enzyme